MIPRTVHFHEHVLRVDHNGDVWHGDALVANVGSSGTHITIAAADYRGAVHGTDSEDSIRELLERLTAHRNSVTRTKAREQNIPVRPAPGVFERRGRL